MNTDIKEVRQYCRTIAAEHTLLLVTMFAVGLRALVEQAQHHAPTIGAAIATAANTAAAHAYEAFNAQGFKTSDDFAQEIQAEAEAEIEADNSQEASTIIDALKDVEPAYSLENLFHDDDDDNHDGNHDHDITTPVDDTEEEEYICDAISNDEFVTLPATIPTVEVTQRIYSYRELQNLAKQRGIKANLPKAELQYALGL